jgi:glucosamine--fructose-6-phosphate aminotransferase (isomerizing)
MCGIYGCIPKNNKFQSSEILKSFVPLFVKLSESRGKDASGIAVILKDEIQVLKRPIAATQLIKTEEYNNIFNQEGIRAYIGHARMETNGSFAKNYNNQPVLNNGCVTIHNGIIVNVDDLWKGYTELRRSYEVDTEIINALMKKYLVQYAFNIAIDKTFSQLKGAYSTASLFENYDVLLITTNTGSLYTLETDDMFIFASERYFLEEIKNIKFPEEKVIIKHLKSSTFLIYDLSTNKKTLIGRDNSHPALSITKKKRLIKEVEVKAKEKVFDISNIQKNNTEVKDISKLIDRQYEKIFPVIDKLKRCTKCILPETFPYIEFDADGVCSLCKNYKKHKVKGKKALELEIEKFKSKNGKADCVVPFSGGRDSSYGVYYLKEELGLNPLTYTYDWGMVTDLARRNIARMTGQLGIENILISADIGFKRKNVKANVEAWLNKPELGMIPLFMAGDKHFFYYVNKVKKANDIKMDIWMGNKLENTEFKTGFCGIKPSFDKERIDALKISQKIKMGAYYLSNYITNPGYLNPSLFDTIWSFHAYYFEPRTDYYLLFDYIEWDEKKIESTLIDKFEWETSSDTKTTWRIGDGTAPLYNYIYYAVAGFNENDTFRSNQIREGMIDRAVALKLAQVDNAPRFESLKWYFDTLNVDMKHAIEIINTIPKLYSY